MNAPKTAEVHRRPFDIVALEAIIGDVSIPVESLGMNFAPVIAKTGIEEVFQSTKDAADLAIEVAMQLMKRTEWPTQRIQAVIVVTQSPRYLLPGVSSLVHAALGLDNACLTFDLNQGCSGFVQGLIVANGLVRPDSDVLLICSDTYRRKLRDGDRSTQAIFSDGATAALVTADPVLDIIGEAHYSDGGGRRHLYQRGDASENDGYLHMSGPDVYLFTKKIVANQIRAAVQSAGLRPAQIEAVYPHQASLLVLKELGTSLHDFPRFVNEVGQTGNLVSSSIPMLLWRNNLSFRNERSVLCGFGVGLSSSTLVLRPHR